MGLLLAIIAALLAVNVAFGYGLCRACKTPAPVPPGVDEGAADVLDEKNETWGPADDVAIDLLPAEFAAEPVVFEADVRADLDQLAAGGETA